MTRLFVQHVTTYRYRQPVALGEHRILFRPRDSYDQRLVDASIAIEPEPARLRWLHDVFGNCVAVAAFQGRTDELRFDCRMTLDHAPQNALDFELADHARDYPFHYGAEEMPDLLRCMERQYADRDDVIGAWARGFAPIGRHVGTRRLLADMTAAVRRDFAYVGRSEKGIQDPATTLRLRRGSCRDFAVLMMEGVRALGMAARFVSGYLYVHDDRQRADGPSEHVSSRGGGATHAWLQVYLPGAGWVEFDPTNGVADNRDLIRVAVARDPAQAIPLHGTWTGFPSDDLGMTVEVTVHEVSRGADPAIDHPEGEMPKQAAALPGTR